MSIIQNVRIFTPGRSSFIGWLRIAGERILDFGEGETPAEFINEPMIDGNGLRLLPGLIDIHTHGCLGHCTMDADREGLLTIAGNHARHGVTTYLPTTMTATREATLKAIRAASELVGKRGDFAKIAGLHLEGPYFNAARCGAQDTANIRRADLEECRAFMDAGVIKRVSLAPEFPENLAAADFFAARGVSLTAGHTAANYEQMKEALNHGINCVTHMYNGMGAFGHREPGTIGSALALDGFSCELICDNVHSHPAVHKIAWRAKGAEKIILITDMIRPSGLPDGHYSQSAGGAEVIVSHNGTELRIPNGALAGSALTLERGLKNFTANAEADIEQTWVCSSLNAARMIGIDTETGSIEKGKLADLVLLDENYAVRMTIIEGRTVYSGEANE